MKIKNRCYYLAGLVLIVLNYLRHRLFGYKTPRTFSISSFGQAVDYDFGVVENWAKYLIDYSKESSPLKNKVVLELGPGPSLGTGLILLAMGIQKYIAVDVNNLASAPLKFYDILYEQLKNKYPDCDIGYLREQLNRCYKKERSALTYIVDKNFDVSKINDQIDIVFSQAAFEHFTDVRYVLRCLGRIVNGGGVLVAQVDLKTHTRWIRDVDPLNIYRYNDFLWNLFKFIGSPNRVRAFEYKEILKENGWVDVRIIPKNVLGEEYIEKTSPSLNKKFRTMCYSEMEILDFMVMAKNA